MCGSGRALTQGGSSAVGHRLPRSQKLYLGFRVLLATSHPPLCSRPGTQVQSGAGNDDVESVSHCLFCLSESFAEKWEVHGYQPAVTDWRGRKVCSGLLGEGSQASEVLGGRYLKNTHFFEVSAHQPLSTYTAILITAWHQHAFTCLPASSASV